MISVDLINEVMANKNYYNDIVVAYWRDNPSSRTPAFLTATNMSSFLEAKLSAKVYQHISNIAIIPRKTFVKLGHGEFYPIYLVIGLRRATIRDGKRGSKYHFEDQIVLLDIRKQIFVYKPFKEFISIIESLSSDCPQYLEIMTKE